MLRECGIEVESENYGGFLSYCPYHGNRDTPAFGTNATTGVSECFNPACAEIVGLERLVQNTKRVSRFEAKRLIRSKKNSGGSLEQRIDAIRSPNQEFELFSQDIIDKCKQDFWNDPDQLALTYMRERAYKDETLKEFNVGYSLVKNMVTVPMYTDKGKPVGFIGRTPSFEDKIFKNSKGLPKRRIPWNIHNAKKHETCIITESSFDAMRVHQAGYPNVVALLGGGSLSEEHQYIFGMYFSKLIIMTDNDKPIVYRTCRRCLKAGFEYCQGHLPGRDLGMDIAQKMPMARVHWAAYDDSEVYPHDAKDASDMTDKEIVQCLRNAISHQEYVDWQLN